MHNSMKCTFTALLLTAVLSVQAQTVVLNLENEYVERYMTEVTYSSSADESRVADYLPADGAVRSDLPQVFYVDVPELFQSYIDNGTLKILLSTDATFPDSTTVSMTVTQLHYPLHILLPGKHYYYRVMLRSILAGLGDVETLGQVRMISVPSVRNVRDMGGWPTADGRRVRYGMIYRSGELNGQHVADSADLSVLRQIGIGAELDMRARWEEEHDVSAFGFLPANAVPAGEVPSFLYTNDSGQLPEHLTQFIYQYRWRQEFQFIVRNLRAGRAVLQHCVNGADRTGYLSLLLEGLLGVTYDGLIKDYELTTFNRHIKTKAHADLIIDYIQTLDGATLQQRFRTFWLRKVGVSSADIDYFIDAMLEGEPQDNTTTAIAGVSCASPQDYGPSRYAAGCFDVSGRRISTVGGSRSAAPRMVLERQSDGTVKKLLR